MPKNNTTNGADDEPNTDGNGNAGGNAGNVEALQSQLAQLKSDYADLESSYKGLQRTVGRRDTKIEQLTNSLSDAEGKVETLTTDLQTATGSLESLTKESGDFEAQLSDKDTQISDLTKSVERSKLIMEKYSDLIKFEAKGVLPDADTIEDLTEKLDVFQEALGNEKSQNLQSVLDGETPPDTGDDDEDIIDPLNDPDKVYEEMMKVAGKDQEKYIELRDRHDELTKNEEA